MRLDPLGETVASLVDPGWTRARIAASRWRFGKAVSLGAVQTVSGFPLSLPA